jgi:hypothetical protein
MTQKIIDFSLNIKNKVVSLALENNETAKFYLFGKDVYSVVSDGLTKKVLQEVKSDCFLLFCGKMNEEQFKNKWLWT